MKFKQINWGLILVIIGTAIFWVVVILLITGCDQRIVRYREGFDQYGQPYKQWEHKGNRLASEQELDALYLESPNWILELNKYKLNNDSVQIETPAGVGVGTSE